MSNGRPTPIAQPGMTAWGRAAERELEAYTRGTALRAPEHLADRVMAAIVADGPTLRVPVSSWSPRSVFGRLRLAGGLVAVILTLTIGGAFALAGAAAFLQRDDPQPNVDRPDDRPIVIVQPTPTPDPVLVAPTPATPQGAESPEPPRTDRHDAVEATDPSGPDEANEPPDATDDADEGDEPKATEDGGRDGGEDADETDSPDEDGSSGGSDGSSGGSGGGSGEG